MDYNDVSKYMLPLLSQLDHKVLNEVPGLENPTSELLAKWIYDRITPQLPLVKAVSVLETPTTECRYPASL